LRNWHRALDFDALMPYNTLIHTETPMTFIILWFILSIPVAVFVGSFISAGSKNDEELK
jgi:hypothetical protein